MTFCGLGGVALLLHSAQACKMQDAGRWMHGVALMLGASGPLIGDLVGGWMGHRISSLNSTRGQSDNLTICILGVALDGQLPVTSLSSMYGILHTHSPRDGGYLVHTRNQSRRSSNDQVDTSFCFQDSRSTMYDLCSSQTSPRVLITTSRALQRRRVSQESKVMHTCICYQITMSGF